MSIFLTSLTHPVLLDLLNFYQVDFIIETLTPFLSQERLEKLDTVLDSRLSSIHIAFESPSNPHNALASLRSAEGFGINHIHIISESKLMHGKKTTEGSYRWSHVKYYDNLQPFIAHIKKSGFYLYGASLQASQSLQEVKVDRPICLLFGNEKKGLSQEALKKCDEHYLIPMQGMVNSFNLSVSCAISLYELSRKKRTLIKNMGDLNPCERKKEHAWYLMRALGIEKSKKYLKYFLDRELKS